MTWNGAPASPFPDPGSAAQVFWACLETQVGGRQAGLEFGPGSFTLKPFFSCVHSFLACIISANPHGTLLVGILLEMGNWSSRGRMHAQRAQLQDLLLDPHGTGQ